MVVADQAEDSSLRKYGRVVVDRTIKEVEDDTGCDAIAVDVLGDVANRDACTQRTNNEEAMRGALGVANGDGL